MRSTASTKIGRKEFDRLFKEWIGTTLESRDMVLDLHDLGGNAYGIIARRCSKLTREEALSVIDGLAQEGVEYMIDSPNFLWRMVQRQFGRFQLMNNTDRLVTLAPVACMFNTRINPHASMLWALSHTRTSVETVRQAFKEALFGLSSQRDDIMRGSAISAACDSRIPEEDYEWFGANWERVLPVWDKLLTEDTITRSRAEALTDSTFKNVPHALMDGAL